MGFNSNVQKIAADRLFERRIQAEKRAERTKAEFFDAVTDSRSAISIGEVAKVLDMGIGQNKLFAFLVERRKTVLLKIDHHLFHRAEASLSDAGNQLRL